MNRRRLLTRAAVTAVIALVATAAAPDAQAAHGRRHHSRQHFVAKLRKIGLTDAQKEQIHAILKEVHPTLKPIVKQYAQERRALREAIQTTPVNEPAIRAQAARVGQLEADLAIKRAQVSERIRSVLTPEQISRLKELEGKFDAKMDKLGEAISERMASEQ